MEVTVTGGPAPVVRTARLTVGTPSTFATAADGRCPVNLAVLRARDGTAAPLRRTRHDGAGAAHRAGPVQLRAGVRVLTMPHRIRAGQGVDGPPVSLFGAAVPLDRPIRSLTLPADPTLRLYALTLSP